MIQRIDASTIDQITRSLLAFNRSKRADTSGFCAFGSSRHLDMSSVLAFTRRIRPDTHVRVAFQHLPDVYTCKRIE